MQILKHIWRSITLPDKGINVVLMFWGCWMLIFVAFSCNQRASVDKKELIVYSKAPAALLEKLPDYLTRFIPKGYAVLDTCSADLNRDNVRDFLLATYKIDEMSLHPSPGRKLMMILGRGDGSYELGHESSNILASMDMGGFSDPYPGMLAYTGRFVVQFAGGSNQKQTEAITFDYSDADNDWVQTRIITENYFMGRELYTSDTTTSKQFGKVTFKKDY